MPSKLKLVKQGVKALLNSPEVAAACVTVANAVAARCGDDWAVAEPHKTGQRVAVNVYPATKAAAEENAENDTARRAVQSMEVLL